MDQRTMAGNDGVATRVPPGRTPLDILKERYARGEIDREEYLQRHKDIGATTL